MAVRIFLIVVCSEAVLTFMHCPVMITTFMLRDGEYNTEEPTQGLTANDFCSEFSCTPRDVAFESSLLLTINARFLTCSIFVKHFACKARAQYIYGGYRKG